MRAWRPPANLCAAGGRLLRRHADLPPGGPALEIVWTTPLDPAGSISHFGAGCAAPVTGMELTYIGGLREQVVWLRVCPFTFLGRQAAPPGKRGTQLLLSSTFCRDLARALCRRVAKRPVTAGSSIARLQLQARERQQISILLDCCAICLLLQKVPCGHWACQIWFSAEPGSSDQTTKS